MAHFRGELFGLNFLLTGFLLTGLVGCGASAPVEALVPVSGKVIFIDKPVERAVVTFNPTGKNTKAHVGRGVTDVDGQFVIFNYQQKSGMPAGEYIVTVSLKLRRDGTLPSLEDRKELTGLSESIPPQWSMATKAGRHNKVTVPAEGNNDFEFRIPKVMTEETSMPERHR